MEEKFKRFLELSLKFTKNKNEVLGSIPNAYYNASFSVQQDGFITFTTSAESYVKEKSTAQLIREEAEVRAVLADEYEEYLELQNNLGKYFQATEKLNN